MLVVEWVDELVDLRVALRAASLVDLMAVEMDAKTVGVMVDTKVMKKVVVRVAW